jgi:hypothetical protein
VTTLCDFGSVVGWPLDAFFGALTIPWSRLLARCEEMALVHIDRFMVVSAHNNLGRLYIPKSLMLFIG